MKRYRLLHGTHASNGYLYSAGEIIETNKNLLKAWPKRFQLVSEPQKSDDKASAAQSPPPKDSSKEVQPESASESPTTSTVSKHIEQNEGSHRRGQAAKTKASPPAGKNMTEKFAVAVEQDFLVFKVNGVDGYRVYDKDSPDKPLNEEGLRKSQVAPFIRKYLKG